MCLSACYWAGIKTIYYGNTKNDAAAIQFDDSFIYDEIKKESENRSIQMIHLPEYKDEYEIAFKEWSEKDDKIAY
jgi:tRNA(Arg) A34 adenosine deaminase TadA